MIPLPGDVSAALYAALPRANFIDEPRLGASSSGWGSRRRSRPAMPRSSAGLHLDVIGRLPTPDEAREFLADTAPDKRARLVDRLLERPEYADHWANKWVDLLRPNPYRVGIKAVWNLDAWIRDAFRRNLPYDQFVREIVTAQGSTFREGPATIFRDRREPEEIAPMVSQLFLGIRLECAEVPPSPVRVVGPGAVLRVRRLLRADRPQGDRAVAADLRRRGDHLHGEVGDGEAPADRPGRCAAKPLFGDAPASEDSDDRSPGECWPPG